jgi:Lrp/AsnC family leucine-responsive transcriptional regulator
MKFDPSQPELDPTDVAILELLQQNCKQPLSAIGEQVGLSAPSVLERIHKLEEAGVILGYVALLDGRRLGKDVTAFIGVSLSHPRAFVTFEGEVEKVADILECHHVTGQHTLMLKVKTRNTESLERLIERIREIDGVTRTETMVVLSTYEERVRIPLEVEQASPPRRPRRGGNARARRAGEHG